MGVCVLGERGVHETVASLHMCMLGAEVPMSAVAHADRLLSTHLVPGPGLVEEARHAALSELTATRT